MHHIFCFDGTQNGLDDKFPTNIRIISELAEVDGQSVHYFEGPGNNEQDILDHILGSAFGTGMWLIRDSAYETLIKEFKTGDKVSVFGFSRGAAIARMFCHSMSQEGYGTEFLGCFDTVFAALPFGPSQQGLFTDLTVSDSVENARHAVSIHEDRSAFAPNLMNYSDGVVEMWFEDNHAGVGGGYKDRHFADVTLLWMLSEARVVAGIDFTPVTSYQLNEVYHHETLPILRQKREPHVLVDGKISDIPAQIFT